MEPTEHWQDNPDEHDYPAALSYLSLLVPMTRATKLVKALKKSEEIAHYKAKDILRASSLALLDADNKEVARDLAKVGSGIKLSPVLLLRGVPLWIADGYHRVCASYHIDEDADIPCRIIDRDV